MEKTIEQVIALATNTLVMNEIIDEDMKQETYLWVVKNFVRLKDKPKDRIVFYIEKYIEYIIANSDKNTNYYIYDMKNIDDIIFKELVLRRMLHKAIDRLDDDHKYVITHRYGINCDAESIRDISRHFRKPVTYSKRLEREAISIIESILDLSLL